MVKVKTEPKSLFKIQILKDDDYGAPTVKNQYLKSNKTRSQIQESLKKKLGPDDFGLNKVSKATFARGNLKTIYQEDLQKQI
jgi:hypothetical protein